MCPPEGLLSVTLYRSFLGPSGIPDSIDFLYKLLGKRKHFPFLD